MGSMLRRRINTTYSREYSIIVVIFSMWFLWHARLPHTSPEASVAASSSTGRPSARWPHRQPACRVGVGRCTHSVAGRQGDRQAGRQIHAPSCRQRNSGVPCHCGQVAHSLKLTEQCSLQLAWMGSSAKRAAHPEAGSAADAATTCMGNMAASFMGCAVREAARAQPLS